MDGRGGRCAAAISTSQEVLPMNLFKKKPALPEEPMDLESVMKK